MTFAPVDTPAEVVEVSRPQSKILAALSETGSQGATKNLCQPNHTECIAKNIYDIIWSVTLHSSINIKTKTISVQT